MKKQVSILLIIAAILILCTGALAAGEAAGGTDTTPTTDPSATASETPTVPVSDPVEVLPSESFVIPSISPTATVKTCTCCGATYTGLKCPNCMKTRCSVCNKCPTHCTCENTVLVTDDHYAYITGFTDGTFRPTGNLTRAEAAALFYRLLQNRSYSTTKYFSDVHTGDWFYTYVSCLAAKGVIDGYTDTSFRPQNTVTRAEFCAMAAKFYKLMSTNIHYSDVPESHWAHKYISSAVANGWVEDSREAFYPDTAIMRQDAVVIVNNMTDRVADVAYIDANVKKLTTFRDVKANNSCYYAIMEAANGHTASNTDGVETWTAVKR